MIFYFTGTGNSLYAATKIAKELNDNLISIADAINNKKFEYEIKENERVGFVFPTYFFGVPTIVEDFLKKVHFNNINSAYFYFVMTCGSKIYGADYHLKHILRKTSIKIDALFELKMTDNYILLYKVVDVETQKLDLVNASINLEIMMNTIFHNQKHIYHSSLFDKILTIFGQPIYRYGRSTKKFATTNRCTGCGKCAMNCPSKAIEIINKKPVWIKNKCSQCLGCINRCPTASIQYGNRTKNSGRFVNSIFK